VVAEPSAPETTGAGTYDPAYFARLFAIEDRHFWFCARNRVIGTLVEQVTAHLAPGFRVLEVGCGTGTVLRTLERACPQGMVVGMDPFIEGLRFARRRTIGELVQGDIHAHPFGVQFEVIGLFDVLEHLTDDAGALRAIHGLLAPDGNLLLTVPANASLWSYFDYASHHQRRYGRDELEVKLRGAGFRVEYLTYAMATLFPLVWARRRAARVLWHTKCGTTENADELAMRDLRIMPGVNGVLSWVLQQECRLLARRRRLPFGTSLLAVARRDDSGPAA